MKKIFFFTLFFSLGLFALEFIETFPDESFEGKGVWSDNLGAHGRYATFVTFDHDTMKSQYHFGNHEAGLALDFLFGPNGWFDVGLGGVVIGKGSCMKLQCQYNVNLDGVEVFETLTFLADGSFYRIGYKIFPDRVVRWEDKLSCADRISIPENSGPDLVE